MIRIRLPQAEADCLEEVFQLTSDRKLRDRLQIVLMAHRGRPRKDIAADLGIHRIGVTRWLNAYCQHGLQGLLPRKAKGKAAKIPDSMAADIRPYRPTYRYLRGDPAKQGQAKEDLAGLKKSTGGGAGAAQPG